MKDEEPPVGEAQADDRQTVAPAKSASLYSLSFIAHFLSVAFHPLLVPTYLVLWLVHRMPAEQLPRPWFTVALTAGLTFGVPALGTALLYAFGRVSSLQLGERRQRYSPLLLAALSFGAAAYLVPQLTGTPPQLALLLAGMALAVTLTFLITFWWKISAHGVGMGGALAMLLVLWGQHPALPATCLSLSAGLVLAAAVAWARLILRAHTKAQVAAGLLLGLAAGLGLILLGG
ncbi:hypothetical protein [Hymenobacter guriensis]|uniref:Phosphatase PAP2 family protein n=1 Tax=Hymenobacter guriensis TaxID=2793065 RepID=A0ABS0L2R0_9BACT|nr:hypothetical protein [Hymenobacter guriensis]MBG8554401.1 hypothetical protein [Hymenobacter guriensis]